MRLLYDLSTAASLACAERLFGTPAEDTAKPNPELEKLAAVALAGVEGGKGLWLGRR